MSSKLHDLTKLPLSRNPTIGEVTYMIQRIFITAAEWLETAGDDYRQPYEYPEMTDAQRLRIRAAVANQCMNTMDETFGKIMDNGQGVPLGDEHIFLRMYSSTSDRKS
jgi:hypothetical protein